MKQKLLIAGGGTGGHIFPGIAIAEEWVCHGGDVVFVGTKMGQEKTLIPKHGFKIRFLKVGRLKGGGFLVKIKTLLGLPFALFFSLRLILKEKPHAVLGIGGYASGPACVAARLLAKYTAITDQNMQPGMTNRILGKIVRRVFISFAKSEKYFPKKKVLYTGNPVRSQIKASEYEVPKKSFCILIFGGSQGAVSMNQAFLNAVDGLSDFWSRLEIYHQAGVSDLEKIKDFYKAKGINAVVSSFFDNMNDLYKKAHLVVCRAGAGTLTELALSGRPAILVPYPFAADDHQKKNAKVFIDENAAWMIEQKDLDQKYFLELLREVMQNPEKLKTRAQNMAKLSRPGAQKIIVKDLLRRGA